jgi:release factor glutamine methyltransferase
LREKGVATPRLDAELLVSHVLGTDRMGVYLQFDRPLDPGELERLRELLRRRSERIPTAYLLGSREFHRHRFEVTPDVLIPRPETEQLVESAVGFLERLSEGKRTVLDLGTGSGCVAISIAKALPCRVWAVDVSSAALAVARRNAERHGGAVEFREGDWFDALGPGDPSRFAVIVSNPPYILPEERASLEPEVLQEPGCALFAGTTGFEAYEAIARDLSGRLESWGRAYVEMNAKHHDKIEGIFTASGYRSSTLKDLQGLPRTLVLEGMIT